MAKLLILVIALAWGFSLGTAYNQRTGANLQNKSVVTCTTSGPLTGKKWLCSPEEKAALERQEDK